MGIEFRSVTLELQLVVTAYEIQRVRVRLTDHTSSVTSFCYLRDERSGEDGRRRLRSGDPSGLDVGAVIRDFARGVVTLSGVVDEDRVEHIKAWIMGRLEDLHLIQGEGGRPGVVSKSTTLEVMLPLGEGIRGHEIPADA